MGRKALDKWRKHCDTIEADSVDADHERSSISSESNTMSKDSAACSNHVQTPPLHQTAKSPKGWVKDSLVRTGSSCSLVRQTLRINGSGTRFCVWGVHLLSIDISVYDNCTCVEYNCSQRHWTHWERIKSSLGHYARPREWIG